jgi:hypothetical protein
MRRLIIVGFCLMLSCPPGFAKDSRDHLFLCRSPLLAFNFWEALHSIQRQGVTLTPKIVQEVCDGMRAGSDPQCVRVEAAEFKPIASGWGGALAMSDGKTKSWFHDPEAGGWVHPDYYVSYMNSKSPGQKSPSP